MSLFIRSVIKELKITDKNGDTTDPSEHDDKSEDYTKTDAGDDGNYNIPDDDDDTDDSTKDDSDTDDNDNDTTDADSKTDDSTTDDNATDDATDDDEANDYSIPENGDDTDVNADDSTDENSDSADNTDSGDAGLGQKSDLQDLEGQLFKDLTQDQINVKIAELKRQYVEIYSTTNNVLNRISKIPRMTSNIKVLEFVSDKLLELRKLSFDYLTNTFDTKTYIENSINYQEYIATLTTIDNLLKEIKKVQNKDSDN